MNIMTSKASEIHRVGHLKMGVNALLPQDSHLGSCTLVNKWCTGVLIRIKTQDGAHPRIIFILYALILAIHTVGVIAQASDLITGVLPKFLKMHSTFGINALGITPDL